MLGQCFESLQFRISSPFKDNRTGSHIYIAPHNYLVYNTSQCKLPPPPTQKLAVFTSQHCIIKVAGMYKYLVLSQCPCFAPLNPTLPRFEQAGTYIDWYLVQLQQLDCLCVIFKYTLVLEALCKVKETRGKNGEPLVTSIANPTSTPD